MFQIIYEKCDSLKEFSLNHLFKEEIFQDRNKDSHSPHPRNRTDDSTFSYPISWGGAGQSGFPGSLSKPLKV